MAWNKELCKLLHSDGWKPLETDACVMVLRHELGKGEGLLLLHVDDLLLGGHLATAWEELKRIGTRLELKPVFGKLQKILDMNFAAHPIGDERHIQIS